jgi:glycyl-tRNA synthetase
MDKIVALAKRRGFIYPGSDIYGGLAGTWDYGPMGAQMKKNLKDIWWKKMVEDRDDIVGLDAAIMMNPEAWVASGHVDAFTDPLIECKLCHERFRADKTEEISTHEAMHAKKNEKVMWTEPKQFNLLVKASLGIIEGEKSDIYLRGEITNGAQVNFKNIIDSSRVKIPFGIAQIGKAFRNEITPGNFTFRSREFEQMETQFYIKPEQSEGDKWFGYWKQEMMNFYLGLGIKSENMRFHDHSDKERAHYAKAATDIEYNAPFGWSEFMGIHHRGDWDLSRHQDYSHKDLRYRDQVTGETFIPWDIETSAGVDRAMLFLLIDAYHEQGERVVLKLNPKIAPVKVAVFPLLANKQELVAKAKEIQELLRSSISGKVMLDARGNIGKRYFSHDEIGTPFCVTIDFQSLEDGTVTVRERDTMKQERVIVSKLSDYLKGILTN